MAKEEAARASEELTAKTEDFAKYRRTKHAEFAQLQASHDSLIQTHAATESQLKALQSAHTAQTHQLTQALARVQDLTGQLAEQEATYSSEAAGLRRLIEMMEAREAQAKAIVDGIEKEWAGVGDRAERREAVLKEEIENQRQRAEEAEKRIEELESVLDRMDRGEFPIPFAASASVPGTPARGPATPSMNGTPDILTQGMMGLSPTVAIASRAQRSGKTFTEVYADYVRLQEDYAKKSAEYDHMDRTLSAVLTQIEERVSMSGTYINLLINDPSPRHPFSRSSVPNMSDFNLKLHSWLLSSHRLFQSAMPLPRQQRRALKNLLRAHEKMISCRNNLTTLAVKCRCCSDRLVVYRTHQSLRTKILSRMNVQNPRIILKQSLLTILCCSARFLSCRSRTSGFLKSCANWDRKWNRRRRNTEMHWRESKGKLSKRLTKQSSSCKGSWKALRKAVR